MVFNTERQAFRRAKQSENMTDYSGCTFDSTKRRDNEPRARCRGVFIDEENERSIRSGLQDGSPATRLLPDGLA